jgi:hypothetical protein
MQDSVHGGYCGFFFLVCVQVCLLKRTVQRIEKNSVPRVLGFRYYLREMQWRASIRNACSTKPRLHCR